MIDATKEKGMVILDNYEKQLNIARSSLIRGVSYDGMPKGSRKGSADDSTNRIAQADEFCTIIKRVIAVLKDDLDERKQMYGRFIEMYYLRHFTMTRIAMELAVSRTWLHEEIKPKALQSFADICPSELYDFIAM
jgi:DNA-directed RNA polymerase specialized sigma subunit